MRVGLRMSQLKTSVRRRFEDSAPLLDYVLDEPNDAANQKRVLLVLRTAQDCGTGRMTAPDIAAVAGLESATVHRIVHGLRSRGLIIADGHSEKALANRKRARLYRLAPSSDGSKPIEPGNAYIRSLILPLLIVARDTHKPLSAKEIASASGCSLNGVKQRISVMCERQEIVIAGTRVDPHAGRKSGVKVSLYAAAEWVPHA